MTSSRASSVFNFVNNSQTGAGFARFLAAGAALSKRGTGAEELTTGEGRTCSIKKSRCRADHSQCWLHILDRKIMISAGLTRLGRDHWSRICTDHSRFRQHIDNHCSSSCADHRACAGATFRTTGSGYGGSRSHVQRNVLINIREKDHVYMTNKTQEGCRGTRSCNNVFRTRSHSLIISLRGGVLHIKASHHLHRLRHIVTVLESRCHCHSH